MITINKDNVKKVFILEDNEERIKFFQEVLGDISYFVTAKANVAIRELERTKFDLIFLDHDLDDVSIYDESKPDYHNENTGYRVALSIKDTMNCETPCIIHSMNPIGAGNMVKVHPFNTCHIPFHLLKDSFKEMEKKDALHKE